ncbi:MAG: hypothetical protein HDR48_03335 [Bacteroides sp.]|nr:hypothetical protein [Bacteroides sp.]MDE7463296.1 hypothetical protein [Muribaculaceae bacterium]
MNIYRNLTNGIANNERKEKLINAASYFTLFALATIILTLQCRSIFG